MEEKPIILVVDIVQIREKMCETLESHTTLETIVAL
jgi:hypothetical protein